MNFWRPLGSFKNRKIFDFGGQHGGKLAPKSMPKSCYLRKAVKKKPCFSPQRIDFFDIKGVEVGSKNRSKNDVKNDTETERLRNLILSIFAGFGSHLGPPKRSQDAQKSMLKWHQNLISFWRPLGTPFLRPRAAKRRQRRRRWSRPGGMRSLRGRI